MYRMEITKKSSCCCGQAKASDEHGPAASAPRDPARIPRIATKLTWTDTFGAWKVRWGIGRDRYRVEPGLYAVGEPGRTDPVFVSSNYKFSFDMLRKGLDGLNGWVLVLDTKGINVWCAAGKGTFGTEELVRRIAAVGLSQVVSHRKLIVPQLSATGVAGYEVKQQSGFSVIFGPVRAGDIRAFLRDGMKANEEMRTVRFALVDRLAVAPVELVEALKYFAVFAVIVVLVRLVGGSLSASGLWDSTMPILGAILAGTVLVPALLPILPVRSFAIKGWLVGLLWAGGVSLLQHAHPLAVARNLLLLPALSAYLALNFTGSTPFTSQSGVNKEIRLFARPMAAIGLLGVLFAIFAH
jgi:hypothetical protein